MVNGMRRFIFITQVVDPDHPALGATVGMIRALSARVDELIVLCLAAVPCHLPANCRVQTLGRSKVERGARLELALGRELRHGSIGVLAHMAPIYALLAAPLCRMHRVPLLLWYTHWRATRLLEIAEKAVNVVVTVDRRSFPLPSAKVVATGHAIDLAEFSCVERPSRSELHVLSLGRYSSAKGLETVIRAVAQVPAAFLTHHGPALTADEERHRRQLDDLVGTLGARSKITLADAVPRRDVPRLFANADALVNNMRAGAPDKVVYESAASCVPVLASNPIFDDLLPEALRFRRDDADELAERLMTLRTLDRSRLGHDLHAQVARRHSVEHWADRVLQAST